MSHYNDRFKDAAWYVKSQDEKILVVGAGGIGSNALYCLSKTIHAQYYVVDPDKVEEHNIGTQFYRPEDITKYKVGAIKDIIFKFSTLYSINPITSSYGSHYTPIIISAVDNMKTRKEVYEVWKTKGDRELLIDGRLRANLYEIYVVTPDKQEENEKTLFDDSDIDDGPCTFKQTAYFGMLIGARITHVLVNYLTNKYSSEPICNVPFKIMEVGEPFLIEIT
jgi:molybdopterin/thiamine biosynthesis adenylyltransferase